MADIVMLSLIAVAFAVAMAYVWICTGLIHRAQGNKE